MRSRRSCPSSSTSATSVGSSTATTSSWPERMTHLLLASQRDLQLLRRDALGAHQQLAQARALAVAPQQRGELGARQAAAHHEDLSERDVGAQRALHAQRLVELLARDELLLDEQLTEPAPVPCLATRRRGPAALAGHCPQ